jgi:ankyrin repeat protein
MKKISINIISFIIILFTSFTSAQETIFTAARNNNTQLLNELLLKNTDINSVEDRGSTALIIACYNDNFEAAKMLLEKGANPNIQDKMGNTALMGVCFKRLCKMAKLLLEYKVAIDQQNFNRANALIFAATFGAEDILKILLENGADPSIRDNYNKTALDYALIQENENIIKWLRKS